MAATTKKGMIQTALATSKPATESDKALSPLSALKSILSADEIKRRASEMLGNNSGVFLNSILECYNSDVALQQCNPQDIVKEALKAASVKLPINKQLGQAYIVAYNTNVKQPDGTFRKVMTPVMIIGYKGYIQLAQRSGAYKYINTGVVYDGELKSRNKLTGEVDLSGEKKSDTVIGYFAYIQLMNGFEKCVYHTADEIMEHAKAKSKSYNRTKGTFSGAWESDFDAMAIKTCLRELISKYGIMSVEMQKAVITEYDASELDTLPNENGILQQPEADVIEVDSETEEIIDNGAPESSDYKFDENEIPEVLK